MHGVENYLLGAVILGVASLVLNLILILLSFGNMRAILFLRKVRAILADVPGAVPLSCINGRVSAVTLNTATNREEETYIYTGVLTWSNGTRLTSRVRKQAKRQYSMRVGMFAFLFVPLTLIGIWLLLWVDVKGGLIILALLIFHQFVPFKIWMYPGLGELLERE
ncbi:hypothetical protein ACWGJB_11675 [Streptomyces sp. NPDC054813]